MVTPCSIASAQSRSRIVSRRESQRYAADASVVEQHPVEGLQSLRLLLVEDQADVGPIPPRHGVIIDAAVMIQIERRDHPNASARRVAAVRGWPSISGDCAARSASRKAVPVSASSVPDTSTLFASVFDAYNA